MAKPEPPADQSWIAAIHRAGAEGPIGTGVVIEQGLTGGELVIVEGIQGLRRDIPVRATPLPPAPDRS